MEIKFFDRLKAMEYLNELGRMEQAGQNPFYQALEEGARSLRGGGEGNGTETL